MSESRVQPHSDEAELATLGAILIDPESLDDILPILRSDDFYRKKHGIVYEALEYLHLQQKNIDYLTLSERLKVIKQLDAVGGEAFVLELTNTVPSSANLRDYAELVREMSMRRALIRISSEAIEQAYRLDVDLGAILDEAERKIFNVVEKQNTVTYRNIKEDVGKTFNYIADRREREGNSLLTGVPSGFQELDDMLGGFQKSEFIVLGARPSIGKTAFALSMVLHSAVKKEIPTALFSLEMSGAALAQRLLSMESRIDNFLLRNGKLSARDMKTLRDTAESLYGAQLWISDESTISLLDLRSLVRRLRRKHNVELVIIDYISLIGTVQNSAMARHEQIAEISRSLKALAREIDIPIIALSQLTRDTEGKRPMLSSIRESGAIEQDADVVLFLHREREIANKSAEKTGLKTEVIVAKQRNGPIGIHNVTFLPNTVRFEPYVDPVQYALDSGARSAPPLPPGDYDPPQR